MSRDTVDKSEAWDAATAVPPKAKVEIARLRAALEELSCPHVTEKPLWWQIIARNALKST